MASTARLDELKKKFDENPRRYFAPLANEFRKGGDIEQAIMICEEFLPAQPGHMSGHIVYGQALYEASRLPEARTVFETALGLDPENLIALRHLGDIAHGEGDDSAARSWYLRVLDADPRNEEIQGLIATLEGGEPAPRQTENDGMPSFMNDAPVAQELRVAMEAAPVVDLDVSLLDTQPSGIPAVQPPAEDSFDIELETGSAMPEMPRAEGLESTAFEAPAEEIHRPFDLDSTLDSGVPEFETPSSQFEPLPGLQGSGGHALEDVASAPDTVMADTMIPETVIPETVLPMAEEAPEMQEMEANFDSIELDDAETLPPHGDYTLSTAPTPIVSHDSVPDYVAAKIDMALPEFEFDDTPVADAPAVGNMPAVYDTPAATEEAELPMELPPEVIAAEAMLTDAGDVVPEFAEDAAPQRTRAPFATETMAELYTAQGFREQARAVYQQLVDANPGDERLRGLLARASEPERAVDQGPRARAFFAKFAARRPGERMAAQALPDADDFSAQEPPAADDFQAPEEQFSPPAEEFQAEPAHEPNGAAELSPVLAGMPTPSGSIDALFGTPASGPEDSAAAALAQAFGGSDAQPLMVGRPARAASEELSLDSVFRDAPQRAARASQSFSFDQFFSGSSTAPRTSGKTPRTTGEQAAPEAPAERSAEDIEQFNSWLQGLKPK